MSILSSLARYVVTTANVTVSRMKRVAGMATLVVVNNTDQNPIPMTIQPKSETWTMRQGARIEELFTWIVALNPNQAEPDIQKGDVLTGYRGKQLEVRSANRYEGPYPYLGGLLAEYGHQG